MQIELEKLKTSIKHLSAEKVRSNQERKEYKKKFSDSPEFRRSESYHEWFQASDEEREDLRFKIRHRLLAYALLRGCPYKKVEQKCGEGNEPSVCFIEEALKEYSNPPNSVLDNLFLRDLVEKVRPWLKGEVSGGIHLEETAA